LEDPQIVVDARVPAPSAPHLDEARLASLGLSDAALEIIRRAFQPREGSTAADGDGTESTDHTLTLTLPRSSEALPEIVRFNNEARMFTRLARTVIAEAKAEGLLAE
jgi:hypothetical protein